MYKIVRRNGTTHLKNVNNYFNSNIYSYLKTSGGQSCNLYLNVVHFLTPVLIRHLWQLKTVAFFHWCLICSVLLHLWQFKNSICPFELKLSNHPVLFQHHQLTLSIMILSKIAFIIMTFSRITLSMTLSK